MPIHRRKWHDVSVSEDVDHQRDEFVTVRVEWPVSLPAPVSVNQVLAQLMPGSDGLPEEMVVTLGHASPPRMAGSPREVRQQLEAIAGIEIVPVAHFSLTRARASELAAILADAVARWDDALLERGRE